MRKIGLAVLLCVIFSLLAATAQATPTASFTWRPSQPYSGEVTTFDASSSTCDRTPCTYTWQDDGPDGPGAPNYPLGTGKILNFTFSSAVFARVRLTVKNSIGQSAQLRRTVNVLQGPRPTPTPTPTPTATPTPTVTPSPTPTATPTATPTPPPGGCTTTVSSTSAAQSAVASASPGATVCLSSGTYGAINLSAVKTGTVTLRSASPGGAHVGQITFTSAARFLAVSGFDVDGAGQYGIKVDAGAQNIGIDHNYIHDTAYQIELRSDSDDALHCVGCGGEPPIRNITIVGNRLIGATEDSIRLGYATNVLIEANEIANVIESGSHVDGIQTVDGGDGLTVRNNYWHDNAAQSMFIKDGQFKNVTYTNNLMVRNTKPPAYPNCLNAFNINDVQVGTIRRNTHWGTTCGGGSYLAAAGGQSSGIAVDHNVIDRFNLDGQNASGMSENNNIFGQAPYSFTRSATSSVVASPAFVSPITDDYRILGSDKGVDWRPADYHYGP